MSRTILQIVQDASTRMGIARPDVLFSSTEDDEREIASLVNELAERIVQSHDWSLLRTLETHDGDGTTEGFDLPSDFVRMPKDAQIWSTRWQRPMIAVSSDDWLRLDIREYDLITGTWIKQGGQIKYRPVLASTEDAKFYYISNKVVAPASGANKARFTADDDTFRLSDRLMELHLIWAWKQAKGQPYEEDLQTAELHLAQEISDDKGARILTQSSRNNVRGKISYPWSVTP